MLQQENARTYAADMAKVTLLTMDKEIMKLVP
jgi:hypothetical protein